MKIINFIQIKIQKNPALEIRNRGKVYRSFNKDIKKSWRCSWQIRQSLEIKNKQLRPFEEQKIAVLARCKYDPLVFCSKPVLSIKRELGIRSRFEKRYKP